jgi:hypothetical protein
MRDSALRTTAQKGSLRWYWMMADASWTGHLSPMTLSLWDPPPPPEATGSSLLYSSDFCRVIKKHLRQDGILQMWYPAADGDVATTSSITKALQQSFPYVRAFLSFDGYGIHFLASMQPLPVVSSSVLAARLQPAAAADFLEWGAASYRAGTIRPSPFA